MMTKGLEGFSLWNESNMYRMMRATHQLGETSEVVVVVSAMAISEEVSEVGTVEAMASEAASEEIHEEVLEVVALEEATEAALEAASEEASEVAIEEGTEVATEEDSEVAIEGAIEAAEEALIEILQTEREIISSIAKMIDIIKI